MSKLDLDEVFAFGWFVLLVAGLVFQNILLMALSVVSIVIALIILLLK